MDAKHLNAEARKQAEIAIAHNALRPLKQPAASKMRDSVEIIELSHVGVNQQANLVFLVEVMGA